MFEKEQEKSLERFRMIEKTLEKHLECSKNVREGTREASWNVLEGTRNASWNVLAGP
jgi:hypothetical protein